MGFAGFTANKTLASHIKAFFALAPVAMVQHVEGLFAILSDFYKPLEVKSNNKINIIITILVWSNKYFVEFQLILFSVFS